MFLSCSLKGNGLFGRSRRSSDAVFEQVFGIFFLVLGLLSLVTYTGQWTNLPLPRWMRFRKLGPMRERWGTFGVVWHFVGYVIVPITFGIYLLLNGLAGGAASCTLALSR